VTATLVLDTTAIAAYMRQSLAVGELIAVIDEDGDTVIAPAVCLAEAATQAKGPESDLLRVLTELPGVAVTPLAGSAAIDTGALARDTGSLGLAHAITEALANGAQLATADPAAARRWLPPSWGIIDVP
jgi:hypothetical protein